MVERNRLLDLFTHGILILAVVIVTFPIYYAFVASTQSLEEVQRVPMSMIPSTHFLENFDQALIRGDLGRVLLNSLIMSLGVVAGKIAISVLSAFAMVYFRFPLRMTAFWLIFVTLMLPVEVRILPTYQVAVNVLAPLQWTWDALHIQQLLAQGGWKVSVRLEWSLLDSYWGLILPLIASATATFLYRQLFMTMPDQLTEAAKLDGAGPLQFFRYILWPMSYSNTAALVVILFIYGWNQYLWPLLITTDPHMVTGVIHVRRLIPAPNEPQIWNIVMAASLLILMPPLLVVVLMQRWIVKGLVESEK